MILDTITVDHAVSVLNRTLAEDPEAIRLLVLTGVSCNEKLADDETIQVSSSTEQSRPFSVGMLGVINGLFGVDDKGYGAIAAHFDVVCPKGCNGGKDFEKLKVGDTCPVCQEKLTFGTLLRFEKTHR